MIHQALKRAEIIAEMTIFVVFTSGSYYDSLLNSNNYILQPGSVIFTTKVNEYKPKNRTGD